MGSSNDLSGYLKTIERINCLNNCTFKARKKAVCVPPPEEILGIIISRDPTVDWLYDNLNKETDKNLRRKILFASAIPLSLLTKLQIVMRGMGGRIDEKGKERLFDAIFRKVYWTHLHKCPTDSKSNESKFTPTNASECANTWLEKELDLAIYTKNTKFVIALGNDVKKWVVEDWKKKGDIELIFLPHPSGRNPIWNRPNTDKKIVEIEKGIERLIRICDENSP